MAKLTKQTINIGNRPNDGTGDSIREAFNKTNENFDTLFNFSGLGAGVSFTGLTDTPSTLLPNRLLTTDSIGFTVTQAQLVGGPGITIDTSTTGTIRIINANSSLQTDPNPTLGATLNGSTFRATNFGNPAQDQDLVTRKYLFDNFINRDGLYVSDTGSIPGGSTFRDNVKSSIIPTDPAHITNKSYVDSKISLAGTTTIDPATGEVNTSSGVMTGALRLFRDPTDDDNPFTAATKNYVDNNGYWSETNLYVTTKGRDFQPDVPPYKRGRFYQYAFSSLNRAARYAEQLIATSQIQIGDYARLITYDDGVPCTVSSTIPGIPLSTLYLDSGANGSDQFGIPNAANNGEFTIFPGQYVQGVESGAIALIEGIDEDINNREKYTISYVDYAAAFDNDIQVIETTSDTATFKLIERESVPIPEFWNGYILKFLIASTTYTATIIDTTSIPDINGIYSITFKVKFSGAFPAPTTTIARNRWFVYSGDFSPGEQVVYNTNVSALQISFVVESGEYYEQYPIKLPANTSIRGDEFRRVIFRPERGVSSSPWATTYFRRDTQIDGMQTTALDTSTNYAAIGPIASASVTPGSVSGLTTFALSAGSLNEGHEGFVIEGNGGRGVITSVAGQTFTVDIGQNFLNTAPIAAGSWYIYKPVNFGYHYLKDPLRPLDVLTTQTNEGGLINAADLISRNKPFIQNEVVAYFTASIQANVANPGSIWFGYSFDPSVSYRDAGIVVDSLVTDILEGGSGNTINNADYFADVEYLKTTPGETSTGSIAITYINSLTQKIIRNQTITPTAGNITPQVIDNSVVAEITTATAVITDLTQAAYRIVNLDPDYNPPKDNADMDVFLCNDANVVRYVSCQNHGGFMMVLDPVGQIKNKSPYAQTNSSFSQSIAKQAFRGGMFVDGFAGNILATPTTSTYVTADPLRVTVKGLVRRPQVPTFFVNKGIRYEVNFVSDFVVDPANTSTYMATLRLNPLKPGGIPDNISVTSDTVGGWQPDRNDIPVTVSPPNGIGGIVARAHATTNGLGYVTGINIDFPGTGYTSAPTFTIGGAIINNLQIESGAITTASVATGGLGYTTNTIFKIKPVGSLGVTTATGIVTAVNVDGKILPGAIQITDGGSNWNGTTAYEIEFGQVNIDSSSAIPEPGFIDTIDTDPLTGNLKPLELITAGNRSMLANDFTQVNDLGYGIFVTNGGFAENVSMFTYYCYRSYYSLNGAQIRSTTGSSCYGEYGLSAKGSDPNETPTPATLVNGLSQIASVYSPNSLYPAITGQSSVFAVIDLNNGGYPPLSGSEIEINHNGVIKTYNIGSANPILDEANDPVYANGDVSKPVYLLSFNSGGLQVGLYSSLTDGTPLTIRQVSRFKFTGFDPESFSRPSTSLTFSDDLDTSYPVTGYTKQTVDNSVLVDILENYNYITTVASAQGLTDPVITSTGSGYTTAVITVNTSSIVTGNTASVDGNQGGTAPTQEIKLVSVSGVRVGQSVTAVGNNSINAGTQVTFVNTVTNYIGISKVNNGEIPDSTTLEFSSTFPSFNVDIVSGSIDKITVVNGGTGWGATSATISISASDGGGTNASIETPIPIAGIAGSTIIKVSKLSNQQKNRILSGLTASTPYYYQFGLNGKIYNVTNHRSTNQDWDEITVDVPLDRDVTQGSIINIGLPADIDGSITTKISLLRVTGHDFVDIGTGGYATTRIPNDLYGPPIQKPNQGREVTQEGAARVYYATTDQDGNFRVGNAFLVNQAQGSVSINAPINLNNLSSISLKKDQGPPITEFSIDDTMTGGTGGYNYRVPTEQAIVNYISRRIGVDFNGNLYAGQKIGPGLLSLSGNTPMAGSINMANNRITNLLTPVGGGDAANKSYVDTRIDLRGTNATGGDGVKIAESGQMTGPLQLSGEPAVLSTTTFSSAAIGDMLLNVGNAFGFYLGMRVSGHPNIATGTFVSNVSSATHIGLTTPGLSYSILGNIPSGTTITLDPTVQAATKSYSDKKSQFNQLRDVSIANATNTDFLMFGSNVITPMSASGTTAAVYNTATVIVNVRNNTATITNTASANGGGSDIEVVRTNNTVTFKLVGGKGANNPITNHHVNDNAAIAQSKLNLNAATTRSTPSGTTSTLGVAQFDDKIFSVNTGWVSLTNASSISTGISVDNLRWTSGGALLGNTSGGAIQALSSSTVRDWLQVLRVDGGAVGGNLTVDGIFTVTNRTFLNSNVLVGGIFTATGNTLLNANARVGGIFTASGLANFGNNVEISGNSQVNGIFTASGIVNVYGTSTFNEPVTFQKSVIFNGTATYVNSTNTIFTDNLIEMHTPPAGETAPWEFDDGKDIGHRFHYYNVGTRLGALVLKNDSNYLEWFDSGASDVNGVISNTAVYGTFKTGGIKLVGNTSSTNATSGDLTVLGGVGVGENMYVGGDIFMRGSKVITEATVPASGVTSFSAGTTGLSPSVATSGTVTLSGTLSASNGGTGVAGTITGLAYANGSGAYTAATAAQVTATIGTTFVRNANFATTATNAAQATSATNADTVTNGVYTNQTYQNPSFINTLSGSKIIGNITGNAANITAFTVNQNVGTSNAPTFTGATLSGLTGYLYGNGASAVSASTTIPGSAITGNTRLSIVTATTFSAASPSNIQIGGGTNGQYLRTDGAGNLSWASVSSSVTINNGTGITGGGTGNSFTIGVTNPVLRNVTSGYTGGGQVFVSSTQPTANAAGDIWIQI